MRKAAALLISLLAIIPLYYWCLVPWQCNLVSKAMELSLQAALKGNEGAKTFLLKHIAVAESCRALVPDDANLNITVASAYAMTGRLEEALGVYEESLKFDRRPEMYFNRAGIKLRLNDTAGAFDDFVYAARFNPTLRSRIRNDAMRDRVEAELQRIHGGKLR